MTSTNGKHILRESPTQTDTLVTISTADAGSINEIEWQTLRFSDGKVTIETIEHARLIMQLHEISNQLSNEGNASPLRPNMLIEYFSILRQIMNLVISSRKTAEFDRVTDQINSKLYEIHERTEVRISNIQERFRADEPKLTRRASSLIRSREKMLETSALFGRRKPRIFKAPRFVRSSSLPLASMKPRVHCGYRQRDPKSMDPKDRMRLQFLTKFITCGLLLI